MATMIQKMRKTLEFWCIHQAVQKAAERTLRGQEDQT